MDRISAELASRTIEGLNDALQNKSALNTIVSKFSGASSESGTQRQRLVLLNLDNDKHNGFWQLLVNDPERFEVLNTKESHQKDYMMRVIFLEKGEDLPPIRTREELLEIYTPSDQSKC